jgi:hypothetical protein
MYVSAQQSVSSSSISKSSSFELGVTAFQQNLTVMDKICRNESSELDTMFKRKI